MDFTNLEQQVKIMISMQMLVAWCGGGGGGGGGLLRRLIILYFSIFLVSYSKQQLNTSALCVL
jgi:hypothetical protein